MAHAARSGCGRSAMRRAGRGDSRGRFRRRKPLRRTRSFGTPAVLRILQWNRLLGHPCANFCLLDVRWGDFVHAVLAFLAEPAENLRQKRGEVLPVPSAHRSLPQSMPLARSSSVRTCRLRPRTALPLPAFAAPAFRHKKTGPRRAPLGRPAGWTGRSSAPCAGNGDLRRLRRRAVHRTWQTYVSSRSCMPQNQRK